MNFDLDDLNPGIWWDFVPGKPEMGAVRLRLMSSDELLRVTQATTKEGVEYRNGKRYTKPIVDMETQNAMVSDYIIVDWRGVLNSKGEDIPCTAENKALLLGKSVIFSEFVATCLEKMKESLNEKEREVTKN